MNTEQLEKALMATIVARQPTFIWGPGGIGKSDVVHQVSAKYGAAMEDNAMEYEINMRNRVALLMDNNPHLIDVRASQMDPTDVRGLPKIDGDYAKWLPPDEFPREGRDPKHGVLFLVEFPDAPPLVKGALYRLTLDRKVGDYTLPNGWAVVAAGNRQEDGGLYSRMPLPLLNRFTHIELEVSVNTWRKWAIHHLIPEIVQYISWRPDSLYIPPKSDGKDKAFPTPRSWEFASRLVETMQKMSIDKDVELELLSGTIGQAEAIELVGFLRIFRELPNPDAILMNPDTSDIPDKPEVLYALVGALSHRATKNNAGRIIKVAERLPLEFNIMMIRDCIEKSDEFTQAPEFSQWTTEHHDDLS